MKRHSLQVNLWTLEQEVPDQRGFTRRVPENLGIRWQMHAAKFVPASAAIVLVRTSEILVKITVGKVVWKRKVCSLLKNR